MKNCQFRLVAGKILVGAILAAGCGSSADTEPASAPTTPQVDSLRRIMGAISSTTALNNSSVDAKWNLLARVEIQENEMVEFYEPLPGRLFISATGAPTKGAKGPDLQWETDFEGTWASIAGGAAIPNELASAVKRVRDGVGRVHRDPSAVVSASGSVVPSKATPRIDKQTESPNSDLGTVQQPLSSGWCNTTWFGAVDQNYGEALSACNSDPWWNWTVCWDHVSGSGSAWHPDAVSVKTNVCPYTGNITYTVSADESWVFQGSWTVSENTYRFVSAFDPGCGSFLSFNDCPYVKAALTNADGDSYNFRFIVHQR